ncbi:WSC domain-containing protein [Mycena albidolilacea]|uniref:WSC domain-containing protein n=1 Tax=Mycena albidolilacea TaxID=1033008 RepID=A0AAD7EGV5_9AGAR|nr:WSC domain-containing protein [Mycena albidolilacea]
MIYIRLLPFAVLATPRVLAGHVRKSDLTATAPASSEDQGCFVDDVKKRILSDAVLVADNMTIETCASYCSTYLYAGLEYGKECYCGNTFYKQPGNLEDCNQPCAGNPSQSCGAGNRLRVYFNPPPAASTPDNVRKDGKWNLTAVRTRDQVSSRRLPAGTNVDGGMTAEKCTAACETGNYTLAGLEYAKGMLHSFFTNAEGAVTLFLARLQRARGAVTWSALATAPSSAAAATVSPYSKSWTMTRTSPPTPQAQRTASRKMANSNPSGVMRCGNDNSNASLANDGGCNMACTGDSTQTCGGGNRLTVFQVPFSPPDVGTTCVETDTKYSFNLKAVYFSNGSESSLIVVHSEKDVYIVTDCSDCPTPYFSHFLFHGELHAEHAENISATAVSSSVNKGDMVEFKHESQETQTKYCMVNNPDDANTIFLAVNGLYKQWAMCSNTKAGGRFDLVWAPIKEHKDYSYNTCRSVILVAEKCGDPDEEGDYGSDVEG